MENYHSFVSYLKKISSEDQTYSRNLLVFLLGLVRLRNISDFFLKSLAFLESCQEFLPEKKKFQNSIEFNDILMRVFFSMEESSSKEIILIKEFLEDQLPKKENPLKEFLSKNLKCSSKQRYEMISPSLPKGLLFGSIIFLLADKKEEDFCIKSFDQKGILALTTQYFEVGGFEVSLLDDSRESPLSEKVKNFRFKVKKEAVLVYEVQLSIHPGQDSLISLYHYERQPSDETGTNLKITSENSHRIGFPWSFDD